MDSTTESLGLVPEYLLSGMLSLKHYFDAFVWVVNMLRVTLSLMICSFCHEFVCLQPSHAIEFSASFCSFSAFLLLVCQNEGQFSLLVPSLQVTSYLVANRQYEIKHLKKPPQLSFTRANLLVSADNVIDDVSADKREWCVTVEGNVCQNGYYFTFTQTRKS